MHFKHISLSIHFVLLAVICDIARNEHFFGNEFFEDKFVLHKKYIHVFAKNCSSDMDCESNAYCESMIHKCLCKSDYVSNGDGTQCVKYKTRAEIIILRNRVYPVPKLINKDPCIEDHVCRAAFSVQAKCLGNICQCCEKCRFAEQRCHQVVELGEPCHTKYNCPEFNTKPGIKKSLCHRKRCSCPWELQLSPDKKTCLIKAKLNDACSVDDECITNHTVCQKASDDESYRCLCKIDYVPSRNKTMCLKTASALGDKCRDNIQCDVYLRYSHCTDNVCTCSPNFHRRGAFCIKDVALNYPCKSHGECITPSNKNSISTEVTNVGCYNETCQCSPNYKFVEDTCDCIGYTELGNSMRCNSSFILLALLLLFIQYLA